VSDSSGIDRKAASLEDYLKTYSVLAQVTRKETCTKYPHETDMLFEFVDNWPDLIKVSKEKNLEATSSLSGTILISSWRLTNWITFDILSGKYFEALRNLRFVFEGSVYAMIVGRAIMVDVCVIDLAQYANHWVIGTPDDVRSSDRFSAQIQIKYNNHPEQGRFETEEEFHKHVPRIEEYYLVLKGRLEVKVEGKPLLQARQGQILAVPPGKCHKVVAYDGPIEYITIRAPYSDHSTKIECPEAP
jgi:mannose-6-phosphate isomerase-like protein (cupin superfamily)